MVSQRRISLYIDIVIADLLRRWLLLLLISGLLLLLMRWGWLILNGRGIVAGLLWCRRLRLVSIW